MEESFLPDIRDIYNCTRQNKDYNVIRKYQGPIKTGLANCKPTKKDHYLDIEIKNNSSPGPASKANSQLVWAKKPDIQPKRGEKQTYLEEIAKRAKKHNFPSPNHYEILAEWPKKEDKLKNVSERINYMDTCQFQSDKTPGPGNYCVKSQFIQKIDDKVWIPHKPLKPQQIVAADVGTYNPCAVQYNTFAKYQLLKNASHPVIPKQPQQKPSKKVKQSKQNQIPGPGAYSTINVWLGKQSLKKNESSLFKNLSKGPSQGVYH